MSGQKCQTVYRVYASLYFILGFDKDENEFAMLELIQRCVESLDIYFEKVTELDLMFNLEKVHIILDDTILKGIVLETNQDRILAPIDTLTKSSN
ncbi:AP-4 complex subunit sigma-like protein [Radiomyces spectabilis]|uniref:AP-4 complex subunit sigma-like protein n=1 Tax=Radiomyces spectabilis TaxID=64574 RepID=UPI00221E83B2|nr:AP-4 complex subunit sigma-like protein [Radiomyces spectabilis]KAI8388554.1 AP-4 complex subunit sigma-like protein [Radiomyces spectabilis]